MFMSAFHRQPAMVAARLALCVLRGSSSEVHRWINVCVYLCVFLCAYKCVCCVSVCEEVYVVAHPPVNPPHGVCCVSVCPSSTFHIPMNFCHHRNLLVFFF